MALAQASPLLFEQGPEHSYIQPRQLCPECLQEGAILMDCARNGAFRGAQHGSPDQNAHHPPPAVPASAISLLHLNWLYYLGEEGKKAK